jgi:antitoxin VapB
LRHKLEIGHTLSYTLVSTNAKVSIVNQTAKLFSNGRSQAVRLPAAYRFDTKEVYIRQDPETGDVILSRKPANWDDFLVILSDADVPADFLSEADRDQGVQNADPLEGWRE